MMRNAISIWGLAALLIAGASMVRADDLRDQLKKALDPALEQLKNQGAKPKPAETTKPADGQQKGAPEQTPAIPPVGQVPLEQEVKIGRQIAGNLLGAAPLVPDAKLQRYVNSVGRWVASRSTRPDLKWTFGVIESNDINAFAAPGGYVFITRGLYAQLKDEAELAGVLGHEIGHVQQKHHLKILQKQQLIGLGSELLGRQIGGGDQTQRLIGSGAEIMARGLDKSAEYEADRIGVVLAARAGYDPWALPAVLQELATVSKDDSSVALLFKTHPAPEDRLAQLGDAMGDRLDGIKAGQTLGKRLYRLKAPVSKR